MLKYRFAHILECDVCGRKELATSGKQVEFATRCREYGWIIGEKAICPACLKKKTSDYKQVQKVPDLFSIEDVTNIKEEN